MSSIAMAADSTQSERKDERRMKKNQLKDHDDKKRKKSKKMKMGKKKTGATDDDTSDHESDLDLTRILKPIGGYIKNREEMIEHMFRSISIKKLKAMLPEILRSIPTDELKLLCIEELEYMSKKRIMHIIDGADPDTISSSGTEDDSSIEGQENSEDVENHPDDIEPLSAPENEECWSPQETMEYNTSKVKEGAPEDNDSDGVCEKGEEMASRELAQHEGDEKEMEKEELEESDRESDEEGSDWTGSLVSSSLTPSVSSSRAATPVNESGNTGNQSNSSKKNEWSDEEEGEVRSDDESESQAVPEDDTYQENTSLKDNSMESGDSCLTGSVQVKASSRHDTTQSCTKDIDKSVVDSGRDDDVKVETSESISQPQSTKRSKLQIEINSMEDEPVTPLSIEKEMFSPNNSGLKEKNFHIHHDDSKATDEGTDVFTKDSSTPGARSTAKGIKRNDGDYSETEVVINMYATDSVSLDDCMENAQDEDSSKKEVFIPVVVHEEDLEASSIPKQIALQDRLEETAQVSADDANIVDEQGSQINLLQCPDVSGGGVSPEENWDANEFEDSTDSSCDSEDDSAADSSEVDESDTLTSDDGISISVHGVCITVGEEGTFEDRNIGPSSLVLDADATKLNVSNIETKNEDVKDSPIKKQKVERSIIKETKKPEETGSVDDTSKGESKSPQKGRPVKVKRPPPVITKSSSGQSNKARQEAERPLKNQKPLTSTITLGNPIQHPEKPHYVNSVEIDCTIGTGGKTRKIIRPGSVNPSPQKSVNIGGAVKKTVANSNIPNTTIIQGKSVDKRIICLRPKKQLKEESSKPPLVTSKRETPGTQSCSIPNKVILKRNAVSMTSKEDRKIKEQDLTPPKKIALHPVSTSHSSSRDGEPKPNPVSKKSQITLTPSKTTRKINIKNAAKDNDVSTSVKPAESSFEDIDKELGDLVKKGASSDVNLSITKSQMEILELEMRARAIKAMLKAQDGDPSDTEKGKQQTTKDKMTPVTPCRSSEKPNKQSLSSISAAPPVKLQSVRKTPLRSTISVNPRADEKYDQGHSKLHSERSQEHHSRLQGSKVVRHHPCKIKPKSVVTSQCVATNSKSNIVKEEGKTTIQQKLSQMAGYPEENTTGGSQVLTTKRKIKSSERAESSYSANRKKFAH